MNPAHQMFYYLTISSAIDDEPVSTSNINNMPESVIIIYFIIATIVMIAVFIWGYIENKRIERLFKEVEEHNKNSKDGIRLSLE